ncbi:MAG: FtsX-like permease family protein [Culicoidibacterales bacterium]
MYCKMAVNNVRKSTRDYTIYFLTLALGVCLFYAFNSISDQGAFEQISQRQASYVLVLGKLMEVLSVGISCVLGALIVYANNFLIKRRKRELGVYATLGMSKWRVASILTIETFLVGAIALVVGLGIGIIVSQILSTFATQMFAVPLTEYRFLWSPRAAWLTCIYFIAIFGIVLIFNSFVVAKQRLIDLLGAPRRNERLKQPKTWQVILVGISAVAILSIAYWGAMKIGLDPGHPYFWGPILLGVLGTFCVFYSLGGSVLLFVQQNEKRYLKGTRMFAFRQMYSKIQTNYVSMTVICLLLFMTIGALSTSFGFKTAFEKDLDLKTPFDASGVYYVYDGPQGIDLRSVIERKGFSFDAQDEIIQFNYYHIDTNVKALMAQQASNKEEQSLIEDTYYVNNPHIISVSDYNKLQAMQGKEQLILAEDEVMLVGQWPAIEATMQQFIQQSQTIRIGELDYDLVNAEKQPELVPLTTMTQMTLTSYALIVPDYVVHTDGTFVLQQIININLSSDDQQRLQKLDDVFLRFYDEDDTISQGYFYGLTRTGIIEENSGFTNIILFIGLYLSFILMIVSVAILALQQLSETADSLPRYKTLQRLGVPTKEIKRIIAIQVGAYFTIPLGLALIHAVFGVIIVQRYLATLGKPDILVSASMTAIICLILYGGYAIATYWICFQQVREHCGIE